MQIIVLFNVHHGDGLVNKKIGLLRIAWREIILELFARANRVQRTEPSVSPKPLDRPDLDAQA